MKENHTSSAGKKFVLQRTEGDLGYAPPDLQTWPTSPNLAGKSSIPTLPHGAERFTANISGRIISGMSTKLAQLQGSGIASSPPDLYLPKGFAGGLDLVHPYHFGNTTQNPSFMIWTETPLNRTYPLQFLMFKPPTATGTYRFFSLFFRPSLLTRSVPSRLHITRTRLMPFFGDPPLQALLQSGQLTSSFVTKKPKLTGNQGSGTGYGLYLALKKLNVLSGFSFMIVCLLMLIVFADT